MAYNQFRKRRVIKLRKQYELFLKQDEAAEKAGNESAEVSKMCDAICSANHPKRSNAT